MSDHRKRLRKASKLAVEEGEYMPHPSSFFGAVYFSTDDQWKAPVPLRVKASDRAAIEDLLRDIRRHHSLLRTTGAADVELSEHGATRALRNIGTFRVNERRAIQYCMAAVSKHLERINSLPLGRGEPRQSGVECNSAGKHGGICDTYALQGACEEAPTKRKRRLKKTKIKNIPGLKDKPDNEASSSSSSSQSCSGASRRPGRNKKDFEY
jgi:hypothetical protein